MACVDFVIFHFKACAGFEVPIFSFNTKNRHIVMHLLLTLMERHRSRAAALTCRILVCWVMRSSFGGALQVRPHLQGVSKMSSNHFICCTELHNICIVSYRHSFNSFCVCITPHSTNMRLFRTPRFRLWSVNMTIHSPRFWPDAHMALSSGMLH